MYYLKKLRVLFKDMLLTSDVVFIPKKYFNIFLFKMYSVVIYIYAYFYHEFSLNCQPEKLFLLYYHNTGFI